MPPLIATALFAIGIAGLFWLDRDDSVRVSKALWLPVTWLAIAGSRSPSAWLGMGPGKETPGVTPPTSLLDQLVAGTLILAGAIILVRRRKDVRAVIRANWPIALYFSYCLFSLVWSDFPDWGFKRWIRGLGDIVMVLVLATDPQPVAALKRLFSRVGFILLPTSVLLIRYYVELSSTWDPWGTTRLYTGVTTNKNTLGNLAYLLTLGCLWQIFTLVRDREDPNRTHRLFAQCTLFLFGIDLLITAQSATSVACFVLGAGLMLLTSLPFIRRRPSAIHALVLSMVVIGPLVELFVGRATITEAMGRNATLSGRTEIWDVLLPMVNGIVGAGFETFWVGPRVAEITTKVGGYAMTNEAHNGYIEVYLNLGCVGLALIGLIMLQGYRMTVSTFRRDTALGALLIAYILTALTYNITEAGFRILSLEWFFILLSVVVASQWQASPTASAAVASHSLGFFGKRTDTSLRGGGPAMRPIKRDGQQAAVTRLREY
jgi:O-antigen ligase